MGGGSVYDKHPDVTDEDLGIRAFQVKKEKAVERAIQMIRHGLGPSWSELTDDEIDELEWILGEEWAYVARADWDGIRWSHVSMRDIVKILTLGSQLRRHARGPVDILRDVYAVISHAGSTGVPEAPA